MAACINEASLLLILLFCAIADAELPNPIRLGLPNLDYAPWFDCANGICAEGQFFMPTFAQALSQRMDVKIEFTPFTRNFTPATLFERIYTDLADNQYDMSWGFMTPGLDPYNFPGISTNITASVPMFTSQYWALIKKSKDDIHLLSFLEPFHWQLWLAIVVCLFLVSAAMVLIQLVDPREGSSGNISFRFVVSTVYHSWAALLGGEDYEWMTASARMLRIALLFLVLITGATYTANLAAFFTKPAFTLIGPKTVADLKDASVCLTYSTNAQATMPFVKSIVAPPDTGSNDLSYRVEWCRDQMRKGTADAIMEADATAQGILLKDCANIARGPDISIMPQQYVLFLRADKPELLAALTLAVNQFVLSPAYQDLLNKAFSMGRSCAEEVINNDAPEIGFNQMRGFFLIFGTLVALAVIFASLKNFSKRLHGATKQDDDAETDAEMLTSLAGKVDQILNKLSSKREEGESLEGKVDQILNKLSSQREEGEPSAANALTSNEYLGIANKASWPAFV